MTPLCGWLLVLLSSPLWHSEGVHAWGGLSTVPSESECRPYIDKALKQLSPQGSQEAVDATGSEQETTHSQSTHQEGSIEESEEVTTKESIEGNLSIETQAENETASTETEEVNDNKEETSTEETSSDHTQTEETAESIESTETQENTTEETIGEEKKTEDSLEVEQTSSEDEHRSTETGESVEETSKEETATAETTEETTTAESQSAETPDESTNEEKSIENETKSGEETAEETPTTEEEGEVSKDLKLEETSEEKTVEENVSETLESKEEPTEEAPSSAEDQSVEETVESPGVEVPDSAEVTDPVENKESLDTETADEPTENVEASVEEPAMEETKDSVVEESVEETKAAEVSSETLGAEEAAKEGPPEASVEATPESTEETATEAEPEVDSEKIDATPTTEGNVESETAQELPEEPTAEQESTASEETPKEQEPTVEDQLTLEFEVPKMRRPREHLAEILRLTPESAETEMLLSKTIEVTLKELKKLYDTAIKPLEILYKYRDLSNRHFGDPEIFSKPLILFMGPWSGGKSTIINYLLDNEFKASSLRTGAEPSPAYFNILMWGEREEVLDGTQLAADWTFSGLQKFGQGLLDRLRGLRLNAPLLEKVNIVEIPGILEIRKQVERLFPFNDACQWFIDRADIIFLVYDPSKLDVGPETEAILDQLKGREYQTRIILNKADQVKPEELMRVQGTLIWNISPLMSSQEPPVMYSTSLWSVPYEQGAPSRLLHAQERAFLRDLRQAVEKRVENKIASARRFAVRVRNHAKMVDCYLTTYYNHKSFFGNRKKVADDIIEHPQNYHIYEGLSTLTNISRYDLPDPEVYRDFFRLNQVYDFQRLSDTCTYFRGCPINRLDVAIAYDLPELVGKWKKQAERVVEAAAAQGKS